MATKPSSGAAPTKNSNAAVALAVPATPALAEEALRAHLERFMRVTLSDGRVVVGRFYCLDRERNVVLTDAYAQPPPLPAAAQAAALAAAPALTAAEAAAAEEASLASRFLGVVMVPGRHLVKAELEAS
jgi:hypothetical protein